MFGLVRNVCELLMTHVVTRCEQGGKFNRGINNAEHSPFDDTQPSTQIFRQIAPHRVHIQYKGSNEHTIT